MEDEVEMGGFECISVSIEPGASDSVLPMDECKDTPITETKKPKMGYADEAVGVHRIVNEGQRNVTFFSQDGNLSTIDSHAAAADKALGSVSEFVDVGHRVISMGKARTSRTRRDTQPTYAGPMACGIWIVGACLAMSLMTRMR